MKFSLRTKTILLIVIIAIIFSATSILVSSIFINRIIDDIYRNKAVFGSGRISHCRVRRYSPISVKKESPILAIKYINRHPKK